MKRLALILLAGASVAACATNGYDNDIVNNDTLRGAAVGAAGGAAIGAVVPGVSTAQGAAVGAAIGAVAGALDKDNNNNRTVSGFRGNGWSEIDDTVRSDYDLQARIMTRYDTNRDNELDRGEGQLASRDLRRMFDSNNDGNISRDEYDRNRDYALRNI